MPWLVGGDGLGPAGAGQAAAAIPVASASIEAQNRRRLSLWVSLRNPASLMVLAAAIGPCAMGGP